MFSENTLIHIHVLYPDPKDNQKQEDYKASIRISTYTQNNGCISRSLRIESENAESIADEATAFEQSDELGPWPAAVLTGTDNANFEGISPESTDLRMKEPSVDEIQVTHLLLDCSGWGYIDDTALTLLVDVCDSLT